jgi:hypothetical protein
MDKQFIHPVKAFHCLTSLFNLVHMGFDITKVTLDHTSLCTQPNTGRKA